MANETTISLHWTIHPRRVTAALTALLALLTILAVGGQLAHYHLGWANTQAYNKAFDLDEGDVPAFVAGATFLLCALLLAAIARHDRTPVRWQLLAVIFLIMSFDRAAALHALLRPLVHSWVRYPATAALAAAGVAMAILYIPLFLHLPRWTLMLFLVAGAMFVSGALAMDPLEARYAAAHGMRSLGYVLLTDCEELLELGGTVVFIHALMGYLAHMQARASAASAFSGGTARSAGRDSAGGGTGGT